MAITPDTKDWTWVIERSCADCGFDPSTVRRADIADRIARSAIGWDAALARPDATVRPDERTWSVLEYGCHLRDVHRIMRERLQLMLARDGAAFANWDQDATAIEDAYAEQDPGVVAGELAREAADFAAAYRAVGDEDWARTGLRSNGSAFTVESFAVYALHDLEHHRVDVGLAPRVG
ncbi:MULTISPECIES: DinB family protein [Tsukamurella]|uniref:DinB family protein n=2 Tax=Tsukamurella TaxID=2060 RepID=A0A5C5S3I7_9ACTN|nr:MULTISPECIES: DinB family protein [Tsukamurella]NMD57616.1 DinB family protein [Tsukamurella columbiensis]TWS29035.1 DinB family protein [Tsukamurella conjunctivitidis]